MAEYYEFHFAAGEQVFRKLEVVQSPKPVFVILSELLFRGKVPWYIDIHDLANIFSTNEIYAGANTNRIPELFEVIASSIARNSKDLKEYASANGAVGRYKRPTTRNPEAVRGVLVERADGSVVTKVACTIQIPTRFEEIGLIHTGEQTEIFGLFALILENGDYSVFNASAMMGITPNRVEVREVPTPKSEIAWVGLESPEYSVLNTMSRLAGPYMDRGIVAGLNTPREQFDNLELLLRG